MATLNYRQRLFVHHFLGDAKDDPVKAARMAGYTDPSSAAAKLIGSKVISGYLEQKLEEAGAMPVAEILARLSTIASLDVTEFVEFVEDTNRAGDTVKKPILDLERIKKLRKGNLIKELKIQPSGAVEVKFHDAVEAMEKLAKVHGMYKPQQVDINVSGNIGNDRIIAIIGGYAQLQGAVGPGAAYSSTEPGGLCDSGEQCEMVAGPTLAIDQPALALDRSESGGSPGDNLGPSSGQVGANIEILPSVDDRPKAE